MKTISNVFRALRIHQWVKNALVLVPVITAHQLGQLAVLERALLATLAFCLISSSVYLVNDLCDVQSDRHHIEKRKRPFAAGDLGFLTGVVMAAGCAIMAFSIGGLCGWPFEQIILGYFLLNLLYSGFLKKEPVLDVLTLAGFYTLRLFAGGISTGIILSIWLLAFSMFFFFGLALVKRYAEIVETAEQSEKRIIGRDYFALDLATVGALGISSGMISVLVLALYVSSTDVLLLYQKPKMLLFLCPLLAYWIGRLWMLANRGCITNDPIMFTLKDFRTYIIGTIAVIIIYLAAV